VEHVDELIAAHALHALDPGDRERVEAHVAECARCRRELREYESVAAALAYAVPAAAPPPGLRERVLAAAGAPAAPPEATPAAATAPAVPTEPAPAPAPRERRRWWWWPRFSAVAVLALAAAVLALVAWNVSLRSDLADTVETVAGGQAVSLPEVGTAVADSGGNVTLYADLAPAPEGKVYAAWVIADGRPLPAGVFKGGGTVELQLTERARPGDVIAVTIEPDNEEIRRPSSDPIGAGEVGTA
jgi:anti-sigma-K factor RskA